jgi:hypothetical protein
MSPPVVVVVTELLLLVSLLGRCGDTCRSVDGRGIAGLSLVPLGLTLVNGTPLEGEPQEQFA